ncbi:MAG: Si-specific NAD(P)(+) transhydrogenase [Acidobacteria bacterium]|nr:Si-specific NAD(P)(+) transhydrogenase [Acidobacteriota bacterium]
MKEYDLVVIGTGPAGHHGAIQAAKLGKSVAAVEMKACLGGACINTGTIPSKTLREAVLHLSGFKQRGLYGIAYNTKHKISMEDLTRRVGEVIRTEVGVFNDQFRRNDVEILTGRASFVDPHLIRVEGPEGDLICRADYVLISTGTRPTHCDSIPLDGTTIFDTDALISLPVLPKLLTVVGGGVIGVEYACMAAALGIQVTLVERRPRILDFVDDEIIEALSYHMRSEGVTFRLGEEVAEVVKTPDGKVCARLKSKKQIWSDALLYAVGRQGNTESLNLAAAGLAADERGRLQVNENFQTAVPHIYAAGDVIGFPSMASVSMEQGRLAACHAFHQPTTSAPHLFPYGIYSLPEISFVGKTEGQLTEEDVPYEVGIANYREIARGQIIGDTTGLLKLLFHRDTRRLLGVHIIGEGATELIHIGQAVLAFEGAIDFFVNTVFNYPTLAECYKVAALAGLNRLNYSGTA